MGDVSTEEQFQSFAAKIHIAGARHTAHHNCLTARVGSTTTSNLPRDCTYEPTRTRRFSPQQSSHFAHPAVRIICVYIYIYRDSTGGPAYTWYRGITVSAIVSGQRGPFVRTLYIFHLSNNELVNLTLGARAARLSLDIKPELNTVNGLLPTTSVATRSSLVPDGPVGQNCALQWLHGCKIAGIGIMTPALKDCPKLVKP